MVKAGGPPKPLRTNGLVRNAFDDLAKMPLPMFRLIPTSAPWGRKKTGSEEPVFHRERLGSVATATVATRAIANVRTFG